MSHAGSVPGNHWEIRLTAVRRLTFRLDVASVWYHPPHNSILDS
jgi:hypothetical protein